MRKNFISGLFPPSEGSIIIDKQKVNGPTRKIGYMLQQDYLLNWRTIEQNIFLGLEIQGRLNSTNKHTPLPFIAREKLEFQNYFKRFGEKWMMIKSLPLVPKSIKSF